MHKKLEALAQELQGELHFGELIRSAYATDASVYRELPVAVAIPKTESDLQKLIAFANRNQVGLIPRAAGTSLAGQCVGNGIVVDISKYFNRILELNTEEKWVWVQPGVIRDELNEALKPHGLWFGPNTSTANRCMIGGMVGNNSSGTTSLKYGVTREHVLELKVFLSDGKHIMASPVSEDDLNRKVQMGDLEGTIYGHLLEELSDPIAQQRIKNEFPKPEIHRRNTGYAVDMLLRQQPFNEDGPAFNLCEILCGSEGTLAFTTAIKLNLLTLPPPVERLVAAHFNSIDESLIATRLVVQHDPEACELMDRIILDCTKGNLEQERNRFFVEGDPAALLLIQFNASTDDEVDRMCERMINELKDAGLGYAFPKLKGEHISKAWTLRKAGLGLLANIPGDEKAVACIEDTAVTVNDLPDYIREFNGIMKDFGQEAVHYAHAGAGELHLRPILNLKKTEHVRMFRDISQRSAELVKRFHGSLSGEHGDGRVRAEFIPSMIGEENYALLQRIKKTWDPNNIFNPGKIIDAPPMDEFLRYEPDRVEPEFNTAFHFHDEQGMLRAAEKCNGSGDCRKTSGGTMCPSYRATRNELDTTRARANVLREFLTQGADSEHPFDHQEIKDVLDLCLSCKACASECPSTVDMAKMKAEFQYQYQKVHGTPLRSQLIANNARINELISSAPKLGNLLLSAPGISHLIRTLSGISTHRSIPCVHRPLDKWFHTRGQLLQPDHPIGTIYFFNDEFTRYLDTEIGKTAIQLLCGLNYRVEMIEHEESGRAHFSKGLLDKARAIATSNIRSMKGLVSATTPLIGIEPSAILSFRDEYPDIVDAELRDDALELGANALTIEEFLFREIMAGMITSHQFDETSRVIKLHGHCHQKSLTDISKSAHVLSLPKGHSVELIQSGCCGMAGSFGYEKEHYEVSMAIGEDVLFPFIRMQDDTIIIAAPGTSCRHQILDGTRRKALHPVEILYDSLKK